MPTQLIRLNHEAQVGLAHASRYVDTVSLTAATAATVTVPAKARSVEIFYTAGVLYVRADGETAAVPAGTIIDELGAGVNLGAAFAVDGGDTLSLINGSNCVVTLAYRQAT